MTCDFATGFIVRCSHRSALAEYEQAMFPCATEARGEDIYGIMLGDDAPRSWVAMMNDAGQAS